MRPTLPATLLMGLGAFACNFQADGGTSSGPPPMVGGSTSGDDGGVTTDDPLATDGSDDGPFGDSSGGDDGPGGLPSGPFLTAQPLTDLNHPVATDDDPTLSPNMLEIYFASDRDGTEDIFRSTRASTLAPWDPPVSVTAINLPGSNEGTPELGEDGLALLFTSDRPGSAGADVYITLRDPGGEWQPPLKLDALSSISEERSATPSIGSDLVYVCSNRAPGVGGLDIYETQVLRDGGFAPVVLLALSTVDDECGMSLRSDQLQLYFESTRPGGAGGWDIWVAERAAPGLPFGPPTVTAGEVNSPADDNDPWISPMGDTMFFASTRAGATADLFVAARTE